jgi:hypothetical protein
LHITAFGYHRNTNHFQDEEENNIPEAADKKDEIAHKK